MQASYKRKGQRAKSFREIPPAAITGTGFSRSCLRGLLEKPEREILFVCRSDIYVRHICDPEFFPPLDGPHICVHGRPLRMQAVFWEGPAQSGSAQSYIRPLRCGASSWPRARMEMRGSGPNRPRELDGSLAAYNWLPRPRLEDRLSLPFLWPAHIPPGSIRAPAAQARGAGSL